MEPTFRGSMNWLHTWAGVVLGGLLFAIFWMGSLSVFDREIDRWMIPSTRLALSSQPISFDALRPTIDEAAAGRSAFWAALLPTERQPMIRVSWRDANGPVVRYLDPASGRPLPDPGSWAGTRFIFPFHFNLHLRAWNVGLWIVGLAGMAMMVLCVAGVIIHRKIFAEFFTFRADKNPRRLILDLHNATGVLGFPFHVAITLSGLIIFYTAYFPSGWQVPYRGNNQVFSKETFDLYTRPKVNKPGELASLDAMIAEAARLWNGGSPRSLVVRNPGDAGAVVQVVRAGEDGVVAALDTVSFDGTTGLLLHQRAGSAPVLTAQRFIVGFHWIQFRHWTLRWLYFGLGLVGCVLIASGYLFWVESRRKKHQQLGLRGVRIVEGLAVGSVTGIVVATLAFFVVNRLLPSGARVLGAERFEAEIWIFYLVWLATFAHAWLRPAHAWLDQCRAVACLAVAAVLLNWLTTGDHLGRSLLLPQLWPIAGMDLLLLLGAALAALAARRLGPRRAAGSNIKAISPRSAS